MKTIIKLLNYPPRLTKAYNDMIKLILKLYKEVGII